MILHAEDDRIAPFKLVQNLHREAAKKLGNNQALPVSADYSLGYKLICTHNETMLKVKQSLGQ